MSIESGGGTSELRATGSWPEAVYVRPQRGGPAEVEDLIQGPEIENQSTEHDQRKAEEAMNDDDREMKSKAEGQKDASSRPGGEQPHRQ